MGLCLNRSVTFAKGSWLLDASCPFLGPAAPSAAPRLRLGDVFHPRGDELQRAFMACCAVVVKLRLQLVKQTVFCFDCVPALGKLALKKNPNKPNRVHGCLQMAHHWRGLCCGTGTVVSREQTGCELSACSRSFPGVGKVLLCREVIYKLCTTANSTY